jgi:GT2 family glycosyltransferase
MFLERAPASPLCIDGHYFQGLHRSLPAANHARSVPAVSGACFMIARDLFERHGGLSCSYVEDQFADFDLCLRMSEAGLTNWYLPDAELYHLEGQSRAVGDALASRYNAWLQTRTWKHRIGPEEI